MKAGPTVETIHFGDRAHGARDNFDEWSQHSLNHVLRRSSPHFRAQGSFWQLEQIILTEQTLDAFAGERTAERLATVPTNQITFIVLLDTSMTYRSADATETGEPGDIVLLDFRRLYRFETGAGRTVTISMDRGLLEDELGALEIAGLLPRGSETAMLAEFAAMLVRRLPGMAIENLPSVALVLRRMAVMALRGSRGALDPRLRSKRAEALHYIQQQPLGQLDIAATAEALDMTRATLYRLFERDGGVLAYDRRRRLRLLHRALCDDATGTPLGELGAQHGFFDLSNLSRHFKAQFGLTMSEVRRLLPPLPATGNEVQRYRDAIDRFA